MFKINPIIIVLILSLFIFSCKNRNNCNCDITRSYLIPDEDSSFNNIEIEKISYISDSLLITGYIAKPKNMPDSQKLPLIIYNRGGNRDFGAITRYGLNYLKYLSSLGYVVIASEYRGNSFSDGIDEFGGKDLNDIKCLIEIAKKTDYIDAKNIGAIGYSRGGLMAYLLSKETDDIKTYITVGAPTDMLLSSKNRPALYKNVFLELIGDSITNRQQFEYRSPVYWSSKLDEPILIIHGTNDERVNIEHSIRLRDSIKDKTKQISFYFIENGDHSVSTHRKLRNDTISKWFAHYLKNNQTSTN